MTHAVVPYVVSFTPLLLSLSGWLATLRVRRTGAMHAFASILLGIVTLATAVPAGSFIYFEFHPVHLPPWKSPEIALLAKLVVIGPGCMLLAGLAFRREPKWLFWILELASFWLFGIGVLAIGAY